MRLRHALLLFVAPLVLAQAPDLAQLRTSFEHPPDDARIMMRWWWFGPAVVNTELEREIKLMKEGGIGGFEVQPVYPLALDDAKIQNHAYLSPEFLDSLRFAGAQAKALGMRMDLTLGSGWPYGGPHIPASLAAGRLRVEKGASKGGHVPVPPMAGGESLIAVFDAEGKQIRDPKIADGWLAASSDVTFFISSRTGQQVKRPGVGAEGFVLDHYDTAAIDYHLKTVGEKLLGALSATPPYAVFCDSLEVYASDWTPNFLAEFQKRRSYDIVPHLPKLVSGEGEEGLAVRRDWGITLTELLNDRFFVPLRQWAAAHHTKLRAQAYGMPPAEISTYAQTDLPEGEGIQWRSLSATRWASSASHVMGRAVTSSETWTWLHSPVFRATPLDMKAEADLHFLQGINQLIGHGWPYTPPTVEYPGWRFYAAAVFNQNNPWFIAMPEVARYMQRVSHMLRQGKPANDVALYMPNDDAWAHLSPGKVDLRAALLDRIGPDVIPTLLDTGYGFDAFDDGVLASATIEKSKLVMGGSSYTVVVLPGVETIPLATMRKLEEFARAGGMVVATRRIPYRAPGLQATAADHEAVHKIAAQLFEGADAKGLFVKDDKAELAQQLPLKVLSDVSLPPGTSDIGFVHRSVGTTEIYFVVNTSNQVRAVPMGFRQRLRGEVWNPLNGQKEPLQVLGYAWGKVSTVISLEPYGSRFVILSPGVGDAPPQAAAQPPVSLDLSKDWKVKFGEGQPRDMATLHSWIEDEETRYYSGTVTYEKEVTVPDSFAKLGVHVGIGFGEGKPAERGSRERFQAEYEAPVREAAVVYVNGTRAGAAWAPPYSVDLTGLLHAGKNTLRIVVGNLAVNYMAGRRLPDYKLLTLRYGERFQAQDMDKIAPLPSGILAGVSLTAR